MRFCLDIDAASRIMTTISASEPLLSEAAYFIMQKPAFNAPKVLRSAMEDSTISNGDRGELLVLLLFILARDAAVGPADNKGRPVAGNRWFRLSSFLYDATFRRQNVPSQVITRSSIDALNHLKQDFPNAKLHLNHFIKVHDVDITSLLLLQGRGAGVLCAHSQSGVDAIITFLNDDARLVRSNAGLILVQIKNNPQYSHLPHAKLFVAMDPFDLAIIKKGEDAVPLIKIIFALGAKTPYLNVKRHHPTAEYGAVVYEIWCAGVSPDILGPVEHQDADVWNALLEASYGWKKRYDSTSALTRDLRRSAAPGVAIDHFDRWADRNY